MKKILFVHQNFPGQFVHLAPALAQAGHEIIALTSDGNIRTSSVRTVRYRFPAPPAPPRDYRIASHFAEQARRGERVAFAAMEMKKTGYRPDIVFGHPGWGETMFLADIWPNARHITYAEFFYRSSGQDVGFDSEFNNRSQGQSLMVRARQASQLLAMETAQLAVSPTVWQASTYPSHIRDKITVIHDGIDTDAIQPAASASVTLLGGKLHLQPGEEVLTFVSRNLEPYRGFHIFMRSLPEILKARPELRVVIVGGDGQSYGGPSPSHSCWREHLLAELSGQIDVSRVHFAGKIPYPSFIALMQLSRVHAYLSYPFVLSWSLLEAMSAGALVAGSRTAPVEEVISDGENGLLLDFFDVRAWSATIIRALAEPSRYQRLRANARETITSRYDLTRLCLPKQMHMLASG